MNSTQYGFVGVGLEAWLHNGYNIILKSWFDLVGYFPPRSTKIILKYHGHNQ
jgi:hypothetical protein